MINNKRIILLCYPKLEAFLSAAPMQDNLTFTEERESQFRQFYTELKGIPSELNLVIGLLGGTFRKKTRRQDIPSLEVRSVVLGGQPSALNLDDEPCDYIRVCLVPAGFPDVKEQIIEGLKRFSDKISHLIYIEIPQEEAPIKWDDTRKEPFDAVLVSGMGKVKYVVLSIMLDILLYYMMGFPDSLDYRKTISKKKTSVIKKRFEEDRLKEIYGTSTMNSDVYLPITLATILDMGKNCVGPIFVNRVEKYISSNANFSETFERLYGQLQNIVFDDFKEPSQIYKGIYMLYHEKDKWEGICEYIKNLCADHAIAPEPVYISIAPWSDERLSRLCDLFFNDDFTTCIEPGRFYRTAFDEQRLREVFIKAMNLGIHGNLVFFKQEG